MDNDEIIKIESVERLLERKLNIPDYQRPYKWDIRNINDLLSDIITAINDSKKYENFKYRIGTIILNNDKEYYKDNKYYVVDGQQRIISLILIKLCIFPDYKCSILENKFTNKISLFNIHQNYIFIKEWFSLKGEDIKNDFNNAFKNILEVVIICVDNLSEAFQLFDSQNSRGKELDPHDLLKAYHLREMKDYPYEMQHAVTKWEAKDTNKIKELFDLYLFPIWNWSRKDKSKQFTSKDIDIYKGIGENSAYSYAKRAVRAMPYFQITEPFIAGSDFFEMVDHYLNLLNDIKLEIWNNPKFDKIKMVLYGENKNISQEEIDNIKLINNSAGFRYATNLFYCLLLYYYDRFHNFDEMVVKKLFSWAFMIRIDMENLGFNTINKYAIGEENNSYSNKIAMFSKISLARLHNEISNLQIEIKKSNKSKDVDKAKKWDPLYEVIKKINGYVEVENKDESK